jgi:hypothetical protein
MADMTDLTRLLQDADPVREDSQLGSDQAQRIRRTVLAALPEESQIRTPWHRPFALAAVALLFLALGTMAGHRALTRSVPTPPAADLAAVDGQSGGERRQLQFSTPGGTRVIWIFDDNLRLHESMP